jgi:hypothetical protein
MDLICPRPIRPIIQITSEHSRLYTKQEYNASTYHNTAVMDWIYTHVARLPYGVFEVNISHIKGTHASTVGKNHQ